MTSSRRVCGAALLVASMAAGPAWGSTFDVYPAQDGMEEFGVMDAIGDDVAVPEPASLVLLGAGLVGVGLVARRRR